MVLLKKHRKKLIAISLLLVAYYFCLPKQLFDSPTSTVVTSSNNELLGAVIAKDGQWRFPEIDSVPQKFKHCILSYEDAYFYKHWGFNPVSICKAFVQNIKAGKVVRGGSTLTQQVIRLARKHQKRSYLEKLIELIWATRLEFRESKDEILRLYASNAPYGGNVVGLEMASWRYFRLKPHQLSWAESATLAVLPNAPSLIYPGKNQEKLKVKRNKLLKKLFEEQVIDQLTYELAIEEPLPQKPYPLPQIATHFVQELTKTHQGQRIKSHIDIHLQQKVNHLAQQHYNTLKQNEIYNLSVLVLEVKTRKIIAYIGNSPTDNKHQKDVDNVISTRSTGSTLKPLLYAQMLQSGDLLPTQLIADVPTEIAGYVPKNFSNTYDGAVPANEALTRSLNIPTVRQLRHYGLEKFHSDLKDYKLFNINRSSSYYGLSIILGGTEENLLNLCKVYAGFAGIVNHYEALSHRYYTNEFVKPLYTQEEKLDFGEVQDLSETIDAGSAYTTLNTLTEVNRPADEVSWKYFDSSQKIAWKTGTSFGNKDAWAIGVTPKYVVGVWVGNSDGEGRPKMTGASSASPLMFSVFDILPKSTWFLEPYEDLIEENICTKSGYLALPICPSTKKRIPKQGLRAKSCPYHRLVMLDKNEQYRVNSNCEPVNHIIRKSWFTLPPLMAYYYKQHNSEYRNLPKYRSDCQLLEHKIMAFVYPTQHHTKISLTKDIDGTLNPIILKLTHNNPDATIFWYVDDDFIQQTQNYHELALKAEKGLHTITVIDNLGNESVRIVEFM